MQRDEFRQLAEQYRQLAIEAEAEAANLSVSEWKDAYRKMARHWIELANEMTALADADDTTTENPH